MSRQWNAFVENPFRGCNSGFLVEEILEERVRQQVAH